MMLERNGGGVCGAGRTKREHLGIWSMLSPIIGILLFGIIHSVAVVGFLCPKSRQRSFFHKSYSQHIQSDTQSSWTLRSGRDDSSEGGKDGEMPGWEEKEATWSSFKSLDEEDEQVYNEEGGGEDILDVVDVVVSEDFFLAQMEELVGGELREIEESAKASGDVMALEEANVPKELISEMTGKVTTVVEEEMDIEITRAVENADEEMFELEAELDYENVESHTLVEKYDDGTPVRSQAVYVDEVTCVGCTMCATVAQSTFFMHQEHGRARVFRQWGDDDETVAIAIDTCPVDCIHYIPYEVRVERQVERGWTSHDKRDAVDWHNRQRDNRGWTSHDKRDAADWHNRQRDNRGWTSHDKRDAADWHNRQRDNLVASHLSSHLISRPSSPLPPHRSPQELERLEVERRGQNINFKARLVSQAEGGQVDGMRVGGAVAFTGQQQISGNSRSRCNNCPSRGCADCPMYGVGESPEFKRRETERKEREMARNMKKEKEVEQKRADL